MNTLVNDIVILILALLPIDAFKNMLITNKYYASYYYLWEYRYKLLNAAIDLPGDFYDKYKTYTQILTVHKKFNVKHNDIKFFYEYNSLSSSYSNLKIPKCISVMQHVRHLCLDGNNYTKFPPIFTLTNLVKLQMGINDFNAIPQNITKLQNLKELLLFNNKIETIPPFLSKLHNLSFLCLNYNHIKIIPTSITKITSLITIDLNNNYITKVHESLSRLTNLQCLNLKANHIRGIPPSLSHIHIKI